MLFILLGCNQSSDNISTELVVLLSPIEAIHDSDLLLDLKFSTGQEVVDPKIRWYKNGGIFDSSAEFLSSEYTQKGDTWYAIADTIVDGSRLSGKSNSVQIKNTPPTVESVTISPQNPTAGMDDLICGSTTSDPDQDEIYLTYQWWLNGEAQPHTDSIISKTNTQAGNWLCEVIPTDGEDTGAPLSGEIFVETLILDGPLITNGDFEAGGFEGWIVDGSCEVVDILDYLQPYQGDWFAFGGENGHCTLRQEIPLQLYGYDESDIDNQRLRVELSSILANFDVPDDFDDQVTAMVVFKDEIGDELGRIETLIAGSGNWMLREAKRLIPANTRTLELRIEGELRMDNINHSHVDDVQLTVVEAQPQDPIMTKAPMLQDYRMDAMTIVWETNMADHSPRIEWGPSGSLDNSLNNIRSIGINDDQVVHVGVLELLDSDTSYDYRICGGTFCSSTATFKTAPPASAPVRIAWMADNQEGDHRFRTHLEHLDAQNPDLLFVAGDLLQYGDELEEWNTKWWDPLQTNDFARRIPTLIARGNHDREHPYAYAYTQMPENGAWYRYNYGSVFVVVLNTHAPINNQEPSRDQLTYLINALSSQAALDADFKVVTFHQAPYTNATQNDTLGCESCRQWWVPVFEEHGVDLVISGHFHSYQRGEQNGVNYVIVAGGGSALLIDQMENWDFMTVQQTWMYSIMDVVDGRLTWSTYNLADELIDAFQIDAR